MRSAFVFSFFLSVSFQLVSLSSFAFIQTENYARFGSSVPVSDSLPSTFQVLSWNVHKGANTSFFADFAQISRDSHLVLLQEAVENPQFVSQMETATPSLQWILARAFFSTRESEFHGFTGVATGSLARTVNETVLISDVTEPITNTPKAATATEYSLDSSKDNLLVVNIHAINFVLKSTFQKHLQQIINAIRNHQGPIVMAGDFNTWSPGRINSLIRSLGQIGLRRVPISNYYLSPLIFPFDHFFVRGLRVKNAQVLDQIQSSDHFPIVAEFQVIPDEQELDRDLR